MAVLRFWIEPVTTVISDCWSAYREIETHGYTHKTVNQTIGFVEMRTGAHMTIIESTWRHVKAFLNPYTLMGDSIYHLAHYMLPAGWRSENAVQFKNFIGIVASMDWCTTPTLDNSNVAK